MRFLLLLVLASSASAEIPLPAFPLCELDGTLDACPPESAGNWTLWGHTPDFLLDRVRPEELEVGIGNAVVGAWRQGAGSWDTVVAIGDSGILWRESGLYSKVRLNAAELPPPQAADGTETVHDRDGNGAVNLADYAEDPRVSIDAGGNRADDRLDPSDLIATFSDGVDDDGNGYIDDIAGWDFFEGDNDPYATNEDNYGDHGTGVMRNAVEEGGDGGRIGVCPNCSLLPIRVGDSFITTGAIVTDAIQFALAHDVAVLGMALGVMGNPPSLREVMQQAWDEDLLLVMAIGDENSFHRNGPAANNHAINAYALGADNREWDLAQSFQRFVNCDNFGPRIELGAITRNSCATGAVSYITGAAGLLAAQSRELLDPPLSAPELYQLMMQTASDIDVPESREPGSDIYPSRPGWDSHHGYGKLHVESASARIAAAEIPPIAVIDSPAWFEVIPRRWVDGSGVVHGGADFIEVQGTVDAPRASGVSWSLQWGAGADPETWNTFAEGDSAATGVLGRFAVAAPEAEGCSDDAGADPLAGRPRFTALPLGYGDGVLGRLAKLDGYGISLRLLVDDDAGNHAEHRRHVFVREDERMLPGFPRRFTGSFESSAVLADFDDDGVFEVAVADSGGAVHVLDGQGRHRAGWPQQTNLTATFDPAEPGNHLPASDLIHASHQNVGASVAVAALDGSGPPDIVASSLNGELYAWRADGSLRPGFPVSIDRALCDPADRTELIRTDCGFFAAPTLVDLDGDGQLEILQPGMDQHLYAWRGDGSALAGYPVFVQADEFAERTNRILSSPAVGDIDGDGDLDIVLGTSQTAGSEFGGYGLLYALEADGTVHPGWPLALFAGFAGALPYVGEGVVVSPALADLDGDGDLEIAANATADQGAIYNHDGTEYADFLAVNSSFGPQSNSGEQAALFMVGNSAFGDITGDGVPDLLAGGTGIGYGSALLARFLKLDHDHLLLGYSGAIDADGRSAPLTGFPRQVEDISFFGSPTIGDVDGDGAHEVLFGTGHVLRTFNADGTEPLPSLFHGGWQVSAPALGDIDGDGWRDVVVTTREGGLFAWRTDARADAPIAWPMWGHDAAHTGNLHTPLPQQEGPSEAGGCAAAMAPRAGWGGLLLLLFYRRSRRLRSSSSRAWPSASSSQSAR